MKNKLAIISNTIETHKIQIIDELKEANKNLDAKQISAGRESDFNLQKILRQMRSVLSPINTKKNREKNI